MEWQCADSIDISCLLYSRSSHMKRFCCPWWYQTVAAFKQEMQPLWNAAIRCTSARMKSIGRGKARGLLPRSPLPPFDRLRQFDTHDRMKSKDPTLISLLNSSLQTRSPQAHPGTSIHQLSLHGGVDNEYLSGRVLGRLWGSWTHWDKTSLSLQRLWGSKQRRGRIQSPATLI